MTNAGRQKPKTGKDVRSRRTASGRPERESDGAPVFKSRHYKAIAAASAAASTAASTAAAAAAAAASANTTAASAQKLWRLGTRRETAARTVGGGGKGIAKTAEPEEETATGENHVRTLRNSLSLECRSYFDYDSLAAAVPSLSPEAIALLEKRVSDAVQNKRIFSINGFYQIISEELKKRGWVEKKDPEVRTLNYEYISASLSTTKCRGIFYIDSPPLLPLRTVESIVMKKVENKHIWTKINDVKPNYLFTTKRNCINWNTAVSDNTTLSQLGYLTICSKMGLANTVEIMSKKFIIKFPRSYRISDYRSMDIFLKDYRLTAILGALKKIVRSKNNLQNIFNANGTLPYEMVDFMERRCWDFIHTYNSHEYDDILWFTTKFDITWNKFIIWFYAFVEESATICVTSPFQMNDICERFDHLATRIISFCPQYFIDGETNIWIVKPSNSCSGFGIKLERRLEDILKIDRTPNTVKQAYIIQKYIENPLTIFNAKVDLRQYFLLTNTIPIQIWMYKEGYVRFCAGEFNVENLCEASHLSNVRVQSNYRNKRISGVPEECMWDFSQFKEYMESINKGDTWNTIIYPSMCKTIYSIVTDSLKLNIRRKPFAFQLLGADFVLTEYFEPWLIEINSGPGLNPSTSVISRIVTALLKDIVKVTVDFPNNSKSDTGYFENIYSSLSVKYSNEEKNIIEEYYYCKTPRNLKRVNKITGIIN